jgi:hypothetical protein
LFGDLETFYHCMQLGGPGPKSDGDALGCAALLEADKISAEHNVVYFGRRCFSNGHLPRVKSQALEVRDQLRGNPGTHVPPSGLLLIGLRRGVHGKLVAQVSKSGDYFDGSFVFLTLVCRYLTVRDEC